jgi:hypothetical protein
MDFCLRLPNPNIRFQLRIFTSPLNDHKNQPILIISR